MAEKHYVGETGTEVRINCNRDLTTATVKKVYMRRPDQSVVEFVADVYLQNYLRFFTLATTFNKAGVYEVQPYVEINGWVGRGKTTSFVVYELYA